MGVVQKDAIKTTVLSFIGLSLGYVNKAILFIALLTVEQVGLMNLVITVGLLFAQLSNLGSIYSTWRFFPFFRNAEKNHYGFLLMNMLIVSIGICFFTLLILLFRGSIVEYYSEKSKLFTHYYLWLIPLGIANIFFLLFESYLRGLYKNVIPVFLQEIFLRVLIFILLLLLAGKVIDFNQFFIAHALVYFIPFVILLIYLIRLKELKFSLKSITVPRRFRKILVTFSLMSYLNTLATLLVISMDAMMIASYLGLEATGVYTTIIYLTSAIMVPYRSIVRVSSTLVAKYWQAKDMVGMQDIYQKSSSIGLIIGLLGFLVIFLPIHELFSFIPAYKSGINVFVILMVGKIFDMYSGLNGTIFSTSKKFRYDLIFTIILCSLVYGLNKLLIPIYGIDGAAISTSFAYVAYNVLRCGFVYYLFGLQPFNLKQVKLIILFSIIVLVAVTFNNYELFKGWNVWLAIGVKELVVLVGFIVPIWIFNLEPEIVNFTRNSFNKWSDRIRK
jgi:O-antigen/teichoic acid export membrane protein